MFFLVSGQNLLRRGSESERLLTLEFLKFRLWPCRKSIKRDEQNCDRKTKKDLWCQSSKHVSQVSNMKMPILLSSLLSI